MFSLGFDTSNYATSLAIVDIEAREVVCAKKRFLKVKQGELGLRQSDALFQHILSLPQMIEEISNEFDLSKIDFVGVSEKPRPIENSYMPCFLAGVNSAKAFCSAKSLKPVLTTHQQGHIAAALLASKQEKLFSGPCYIFHISGGTTDLILYNGMNDIRELGTSLDLYAGQAVDRLGVSLGYPFPSGSYISQLAKTCTEKIIPKTTVRGLNCHLSGLQNQCEALLEEGKSAEYVSKFCLISIAKTIVQMTQNAFGQFGELPVVCAGGVMSSELISQFVSNRLNECYFVPSLFSSDNAIGVAAIAGGCFNV